MTKKLKILDVSHQFVPALDSARVVNPRLATQQKPSGFGTGWNAINGYLERSRRILYPGFVTLQLEVTRITVDLELISI